MPTVLKTDKRKVRVEVGRSGRRLLQKAREEWMVVTMSVIVRGTVTVLIIRVASY